MAVLPDSGMSLMVRTDFADDDAWQHLLELAAAPQEEEEFTAEFIPVSDPAFDGADWATVKAALPDNEYGASVLFIADAQTLSSPEHPIIVVDLIDDEDAAEAPFRCVPHELWGVENNLNISNMDFQDFAGAADDDGVFRGFPNDA